MSKQHYELVEDPAAWYGKEIVDEQSWQFAMDDQQRAELRDALAKVQAQSLTLPEITRDSFKVGEGVISLCGDIVDQMKSGRGIALVRGFPIEDYSDEEVRMMYWGMSQHMGTCVSQDPDCAFIADVKEKGLGDNTGARAYGNKHGTRNHVDLADVVGLLGVRQAAQGARSTLASSLTIYNEFVKQHPEWLPVAFEGFYWDRYGEQKEWEEAVSPTKVPLFSFSEEGQLSVRYNRNWITRATTRRGIPFTEEEVAILDFFDQMGIEHGMSVKMGPGDVYFANNYVALHGRESYVEHDNTPHDQRRLFLRVWINLPNLRTFADESLIRYGLTSHGNIGFTSKEICDGKHLIPHYQRVRVEAEAVS